MAGFGSTSHHDFLQGAGWGLVAQSVAMLMFDQFAAARAVTWQHQLDEAARVLPASCPAR